MLFAEAPMIDPGFIILLLVALALFAAAMVTLVIGTVVAGRRYGLDPTRRLAQAVWLAGMAIEATFLASGLITAGGEGWTIPAAIALGGAMMGWHDGRRRADPTAGPNGPTRSPGWRRDRGAP